jgi:hypothetical protein
MEEHACSATIPPGALHTLTTGSLFLLGPTHCDFMRMAEEAGFTVCDLIIKIRNGPMLSNKWKEAHHARKRHCFWIVCRNEESCERQ